MPRQRETDSDIKAAVNYSIITGLPLENISLQLNSHIPSNLLHLSLNLIFHPGAKVQGLAYPGKVKEHIGGDEDDPETDIASKSAQYIEKPGKMIKIAVLSSGGGASSSVSRSGGGVSQGGTPGP